MRNAKWVLLAVPVLILATAAATQDARGLLQAADRAMGASAVNSVQFSGTGWMVFVGQSFAAGGDWPRVDLKSYTETSMLDVSQHVPIHGNPGPQADFERIVGPAVARQQSGAGTGN